MEYNQGQLLWGQLAGAGISSTRTEAFGFLAGLTCPGPIHAGIDNAGVVKRAKALLKARRRNAHVRHWALQDDGDVWQAIDQGVQSKGLAAVAVSKVKGHATINEVHQGLVTAAQRDGNNAADTGADKGQRMQDKWRHQVFQAFAVRQKFTRQSAVYIQT